MRLTGERASQGLETGEEWSCNCSLTGARAKKPWRSSGEETRDVGDLWKVVLGKERAALDSTLTSGYPRSFHSTNLISLRKLRGVCYGLLDQ